MPPILLVALGSAAGGVARWALAGWIDARTGPGFWGTLAVNVIGSGFIGWLAASLAPHPASARLFWMTGVCGGFTTFSAFSLETFNLVQEHDHARAAAYAVASLVLCGLSVLGGAALGRGR